jgi:hypothetical protein
MDIARSQELGLDLEGVADLIKSPTTDTFRFNEREQTILKLWDQEEEIRLELTILKTQTDSTLSGSSLFLLLAVLTASPARHDNDISTLSDQQVQTEIKKAERQLLEARSKYTLRNQIIQNVIITDPVLKAVHSGAGATELERRLLPLIIERDTLSMVYSVLSTRLQTANSRLATLEREKVQAIAENKEKSRAMLELANELKVEMVEEVEDARLRKQMEKLVDDLKKVRTEWRVMKSLVAGVVAGSGVDWAKDPRLLSLVLDEEDELG